MDRQDDEGHSVPSQHSCLVAIGRLQVTSAPSGGENSQSNNTSEFVSRHSVEGKFTFVDQK